MNADSLKALLIRDKQFLKELYENVSYPLIRKCLQNAEDFKLKTLFWYLHFLSNGSITIKKEIFEKIPFAKIKTIQKNLERKNNCKKMMKNDRHQQMQFLMKFVNIYNYLLHPLFNE